MSCTDCQRDLNRYCPTCLNCGQRYIRDVKARRMPLEEKQAWLRSILKTWMDFGHAEADLRAGPNEQAVSPEAPRAKRGRRA
jgi:hypothetical protein